MRTVKTTLVTQRYFLLFFSRKKKVVTVIPIFFNFAFGVPLITGHNIRGATDYCL